MKIISKAKRVPDSSIVRYGEVIGVLTRNRWDDDNRVFIITGSGCGIEIDENDTVELVKSSTVLAEDWMEQYRLIMSIRSTE